MCRHAAYIGPPAPLAPLLVGLEHSLLHQSYAARELLPGVTVNADGFAVAWYDTDVRPEPARYARGDPIWSDADLPRLASLVHSTTFLAAVRSATVAGQNTASNAAPFAHGRWSWSLNGYLRDFSTVWRDHIEREWLTPAQRNAIQGTTDAEYLFHAFLARLEGEEPMAALRGLVADVKVHAQQHGTAVQLNLLVSDGDRILATRDGTETTCNSLYHLADGAEFPDAHVVASEPMTTGEWQEVQPQTLLVLSAGAPPVRLPL